MMPSSAEPRPRICGILSMMDTALLREFRARHLSIRTRWVDLLRAEPVSTPLALPDALVHLMDTTLETIFAGLARSVAKQSQSSRLAVCTCGRNPYLTYFAAAEQALHEGLIFAQVACLVESTERDASLAELRTVLTLTSQQEIESFCSVCQFRNPTPTPKEPATLSGC